MNYSIQCCTAVSLNRCKRFFEQFFQQFHPKMIFQLFFGETNDPIFSDDHNSILYATIFIG